MVATWKTVINLQKMATSLTKSFVAPPSLGERLQKEEEFFSKPFLMSYSGLNKLLYSPALFYQHYVLKQRDDTQDQNMIEGSLIHCLLLRPESFNDAFILSMQDAPSDNPKQVMHMLLNHYKELKAMGDKRENLDEFPDAILDILRDMNLYQSLKTDAQRLDKMLIPKHYEYWAYLTKMEGKIIVDQATYDFCKSVVDKITANAVVMDKMGYFGDSMNGITKENEIEMVAFPEEYTFGLRGFVDNLVFDPMNKIIRVNDLKKTGKDLNSFKDSIEYFRYWIQAAMYHMMVADKYLTQPQYADWTIEFRFIVVDPYMQIAPIAVSKETMETWIVQTKQELQKASYHFETKRFELPYEFLLNEELTL